MDDKNDNEEGRAPLEYLPRGPRVFSYATADIPPVATALLASVKYNVLNMVYSVGGRLLSSPIPPATASS